MSRASEVRLIFTVTAGRSGQASLTELLNRHVADCVAMFEEPQVRPRLPRVFGDLERRFRRRFVETHELLGRGRVLTAFDAGDEAALDGFAARRLRWIDRQASDRKARVFVDVSKYFARGQHRALLRARPNAGLIRLVRDPLLNMRSFLNRGKTFALDNNDPDNRHNQLRLDPANLEKGELYLWAWCEMYLRFDALVAEFAPAAAIEIRTEHLNDAGAMSRHLTALGLEHTLITPAPPRNTNASKGFGDTTVPAADAALFERFRDRLPGAILDRIPYLTNYYPEKKVMSA